MEKGEDPGLSMRHLPAKEPGRGGDWYLEKRVRTLPRSHSGQHRTKLDSVPPASHWTLASDPTSGVAFCMLCINSEVRHVAQRVSDLAALTALGRGFLSFPNAPGALHKGAGSEPFSWQRRGWLRTALKCT